MSADGLAASERRAGVLAALAFLATLLAGFALGVTADRLWLHRRPSGFPPMMGRGGPPPPDAIGGGPESAEREERFRRRMVEQLAKDLELTPAQRRTVDSLIAVQGEEFRALREEMRPRMEAFLARSKQGIEAVLTPEQRARFKELRPPPPVGGPGRPGTR